MNNKELIQNYIDSHVSESRRPTWNWLLDSDIADDNESGLTYAPGTIQEAILSDTRGKKTKSMNSIKKDMTSSLNCILMHMNKIILNIIHLLMINL